MYNVLSLCYVSQAQLVLFQVNVSLLISAHDRPGGNVIALYALLAKFIIRCKDIILVVKVLLVDNQRLFDVVLIQP